MKKLILVAMLGISSTAFAAEGPLLCRDMDAGMDNGYNVLISRSRKSATVERITIAGAEELANLRCRRLPRGRPIGADIPYAWLGCSEPNLRDAGYSLVVSSGGFAGLTTAVLSEVTIAGAQPVAHLICNELNVLE